MAVRRKPRLTGLSDMVAKEFKEVAGSSSYEFQRSRKITAALSVKHGLKYPDDSAGNSEKGS